MSITGKSSLSLKRKDVIEQRSMSTGFKKLQFAHKATLGDTGISLTSLSLPSEMSGFTNPNSSELAAAQLFFYRKNLTLISSIKGVLIDYLSYTLAGSTQINFVGFTAEDGEIFTGIIDHNARTGINLVDAAPLTSTGELAIAATDYNVGQLFEINKYSTQQVGAVLVYRNGTLQARNSGNSSTVLDGNYYEVNNGSGTGQIIRFNVAPVVQSDAIMVVSNGLMAYNPDGSALQMIESLSGKVDSIVPTVAALAGVPESNFGGVSNADLKSFGDLVLSNDTRINSLESINNTYSSILSNTKTPSGSGQYYSLVNNSITIPNDEVWELTGSMLFASAGATNYNYCWAYWRGANGADNGVNPGSLGANKLAGGNGAEIDGIVNANNVLLTLPTIRVNGGITVYLVPYAGMGTPANSRITATIYGKRVY